MLIKVDGAVSLLLEDMLEHGPQSCLVLFEFVMGVCCIELTVTSWYELGNIYGLLILLGEGFLSF